MLDFATWRLLVTLTREVCMRLPVERKQQFKKLCLVIRRGDSGGMS